MSTADRMYHQWVRCPVAILCFYEGRNSTFPRRGWMTVEWKVVKYLDRRRARIPNGLHECSAHFKEAVRDGQLARG